jgi:UDP-N-acetylglucosamine:LPS N-acetylglucosamine transferase
MMNPMRTLLVGSSGGHLAQLHQLKPWWERHDRLWVTFEKPDALSLLAGENTEWAYQPTTRNIPNMLRNLRLSWKVLRRYRPDVVVFPFFVMAKALRMKTVYVEVYDRIDSKPLTSKLCYPFSDLFLVQWDEQQKLFPKSQVIGRLF